MAEKNSAKQEPGDWKLKTFYSQPLTSARIINALLAIVKPQHSYVPPLAAFHYDDIKYLCSVYSRPANVRDKVEPEKAKPSVSQISAFITDLFGANTQKLGPWCISPLWTLTYFCLKYMKDDCNCLEFILHVQGRYREENQNVGAITISQIKSIVNLTFLKLDKNPHTQDDKSKNNHSKYMRSSDARLLYNKLCGKKAKAEMYCLLTSHNFHLQRLSSVQEEAALYHFGLLTIRNFHSRAISLDCVLYDSDYIEKFKDVSERPVTKEHNRRSTENVENLDNLQDYNAKIRSKYNEKYEKELLQSSSTKIGINEMKDILAGFGKEASELGIFVNNMVHHLPRIAATATRKEKRQPSKVHLKLQPNEESILTDHRHARAHFKKLDDSINKNFNIVDKNQRRKEDDGEKNEKLHRKTKSAEHNKTEHELKRRKVVSIRPRIINEDISWMECSENEEDKENFQNVSVDLEQNEEWMK